MAKLGFIYPGHSGESDYELLADALGPDHQVLVEHTPVPLDLHREDALRMTGDPEHVGEGARRLKAAAVDSSMWACTSASFVFGYEGARRQAEQVAEITGAPSSSTSLAFAEALRRLGVDRAVIAATYPADVTRLFQDFLSDAGVEADPVASLGLLAAGEVSAMDADQIVALAASAEPSRSGAVLLPDTAMRSLPIIERLEAESQRLILTANQVTAWMGMRLAGVTAQPEGLGRLFRDA